MEHSNQDIASQQGYLFPNVAGEGESTSAEDRRLFERYAYRQQVSVVWMDGAFVQRRIGSLLAADISRGGLKLVGRQMLHRGAVGVVMLRASDGEAMLRGIRVQHCVYAGDLLYASGCEFVPAPDKLMRAVRVVDGAIQLSTRPEDFV